MQLRRGSCLGISRATAIRCEDAINMRPRFDLLTDRIKTKSSMFWPQEVLTRPERCVAGKIRTPFYLLVLAAGRRKRSNERQQARESTGT